jgi:hypothetical protein
MNYTMDSVEHAKAVLIEKTKLEVKSFLPVFMTDIKDLSYFENRYFFGVITVGNNVSTAILNYEQNPIITISSNTQVIDLFQSLDCTVFTDIETSSQYDFEGSFRGFEILMG